uniref:Major facilitator superfamily (MFS) profile domain-containing protein n=1 Tax=Meloidogyne javanica TaxID=6303 RepID=A0A915N4R2_MELJA
ANKRQINTGDIGLIIGTYQLSRFIMAPFTGKYIMSIGASKAFFFSLFLTAFTAFGFGLLTLLPNGFYFFWASLAIRIVQALARTVFVISSLTIMAQLFPANISLLGGLLEAFAGFGYISGPVIGSVLFDFGGTDNSSNNGLLSVLRLYSTWLIMLVITTRGITCSFFQAPLPEHLNSVNHYNGLLIQLNPHFIVKFLRSDHWHNIYNNECQLLYERPNMGIIYGNE